MTATTVKNVWLDHFNENYYGRSKEAQDLKPFLKETYKGDVYLPWAVMERLMRQQDPDSDIIKVYINYYYLVVKIYKNLY